MKRIAIIPARGGSKRIPRKNIKLFLGEPIISYSIRTALDSNLFDEVMVSTDDKEIAEIALKFGASVPFLRSSESSKDTSTTIDVINKLGLHARASGKLIEVTTKFSSSIQIGKADKLVDAKNIMSLLMLGAGKGTTLRLVIDGADEEKALEEIQTLFAAKFYEAE